MNRLTIVFCLIAGLSFAQSFAPPPGFPGSTAIHKDSSILIDWANGCTITRGPLNIQTPGLGDATYGVDADGIGYPDGVAVVSLGDGGNAILTFPSPIINGPGPDFAIFENGFDNHYMELAFVEVSSDGVNYHRFDGISEVPTDIQLTNFSFSDCSMIYNLAGKYRVNYGTPFDLNEMDGIPGLDVYNITHVKLIDVVGSIDPLWGTVDSQGTIINDTYPTEFESGGFDLDAIGVIHSFSTSIDEADAIQIKIFPNPSNDIFHGSVESSAKIFVHDVRGELIVEEDVNGSFSVNLSDYSKGVYLLNIQMGSQIKTVKLIKL
jgi:Secretion system C-terminal sorting domain